MSAFTRRRLLGATALATALATGSLTLDACSAGSPSGGPTSGIRWWDHFGSLQKFHAQFAADYAASSGTPTEFTYYEVSKLGPALQLAKQSSQLPDIHTTAGLGLPTSALIKDDWFQPMTLSKDATTALGNTLIEGVHIFDGKTYTFPIFSPRQYSAATWFNTELAAAAGIDPATPPRTYDEFRAACVATKSSSPGAYGFTVALNNPDRMGEQVNDMAQAAGFQGLNGMRFVDGEFAYDDDAYLKVLDLLVSLNKDGHLVPGSESFTVSTARARWATGIATYFIDGPWCAGGVVNNLSEFTDKIDVGPILVPEPADTPKVYRGPAGGVFYLSSESNDPDAANGLLSSMTQPTYLQGLAKNMDQPPADLDVIAEAGVHPSYARIVDYFQKSVFLAPTPIVRNPDVGVVQAETKPVNPPIGVIVQGLLSGDVADARSALRQLNDASSAAREAAMKKAKSQGAKVSMDDFAFSDWKPGTDYNLT